MTSDPNSFSSRKQDGCFNFNKANTRQNNYLTQNSYSAMPFPNEIQRLKEQSMYLSCLHQRNEEREFTNNDFSETHETFMNQNFNIDEEEDCKL
jgi:hypothetical protein